MEEAFLNITFAGGNGDLRDPINFDAPDVDIKAWAAEAVRNGDIAGIGAHADVDFRDFVVDRFTARDDKPNRVMLRPKTAYGR